ncbi:MAG: SpaH/EbpB family LPXTG-anchored major pilin [Oscillospiraceae bacterium]|nr:SpaH/EbpB family LPXTG-anchored major pilin [Oscillospiraceae bacterium]
MKHMRKLFAVLLAVMMVMGLATTAFAATVDNQTEHSYAAYQVFTGTQSTDSSALGEVKWGTGVDGEALLTDLKKLDNFKDCTDAASVADVLAGQSDKSQDAKDFANVAAKHLTDTSVTIAASATSVDLAAGYYLLVDTSTVGDGDAMNTALLQVTNKGNVTIEKKYTVPTVEKKIVEGTTEKDASDYGIGDTINYKLTGTLPSNYADYETYKYVFTDTLTAGLTYPAATAGTAKVYVVNDDTETALTKDTDYTLDYKNHVLTVTLSNLRAITTAEITSDSKIVVKYTAKLNSNAVIGSAGNPNTVVLSYSNNPNQTGTGEPTTSNTPEDKVLVFTYKLDVDKIDGTTSAGLSDAEFVLMNADKTKVAKVSNGKITGWATDSSITKDTDGTYPAAYTLTSDTNGDFALQGLDAATYYLVETKAPAGYNKLKDPIKVVISATVNKDKDTSAALEKLTISVDDGTAENGTISTGVVEMDVKNNQGSTLPETGGIGTTIFYVLGGVLVLAAVVLLVTKKRMSTAE